MGAYRSAHALAGPLTPEQVHALAMPLTPRCRRGYRTEDVDALLHRLAYELHRRIRERDEALAENRRIKNALRDWRSARTTQRQGHDLPREPTDEARSATGLPVRA
ncbi:DivIVA domain-containing protein [Micromonospora matsumotoense]|uniref:DivIVA domain-containing protein n=1 Tax=Micromonospora matsumotoense TaxID=121616 RepID=A0A1C5AHA3_9ACTN|nr:DivIVA domain-containing protein [Micromonospora matsumotoense]SCF44404.1 DivIVA domain-containing protein [Micromonospora matsumotoense]